MAYFDTNKENGKETIELASLMNEAASAVISNAVFELDSEQEERHKVTACRALWTVIGYCEAMLSKFGDEERDKALSETARFFSGGKFHERSAADAFIEAIILDIFE